MKTVLSIVVFTGMALAIAGVESSIVLTIVGLAISIMGVIGAALYTYLTNPKEFEFEWKRN